MRSLTMTKNMKCPAYANTGFVILKKASKNELLRVISNCRVAAGVGCKPAPTMPMIPATKIEKQETKLSQDMWSSVRGNDARSVKMA